MRFEVGTIKRDAGRLPWCVGSGSLTRLIASMLVVCIRCGLCASAHKRVGSNNSKIFSIGGADVMKPERQITHDLILLISRRRLRGS